MLTLLLVFISACLVAASFFIDASKFIKRVICLVIGLYVAIIITPLLLPSIVTALEGVLPIVFIRIILILAILLGVNAIVTKLWQKTSRLLYPSLDQAGSRSKASVFLTILFNVTLGFCVFVTVLLGFATAVDYKLFTPIVSKETYYQTIANAISDGLFGRAPTSHYIVASRKSSPQAPAPVDQSAQQPVDKYSEYKNYDRARKTQSKAANTNNSQLSRTDRTTTTNQKAVNNKSEATHADDNQFELPDLNLNDKDVEVLQEIVTEEIASLLKENPEELKRALSEALTEEKGAELSAIIDSHIREGKKINELMERIELFMGDPKNLSTEFKEALPDMLREMDFVKD